MFSATSVRKLISEIWEKPNPLHGKVEKGKQTSMHGERSAKYGAIVAHSKRSTLAEEVASVVQKAAGDVMFSATSVRKLISEIWEKPTPLHENVERGKQTPAHGEKPNKYRASVADSKRSTWAEEVASVVKRAADDVRAAGHEVSPKIIEFAEHEARINFYMDGTNMLEHVRKVLLREAAEAYVCSVTNYKRQGLNLILSLSSLEGETLEIRVNREVSIAGVAGMVQATVQSVGQGKVGEVKLVRPNGTLLPCARAIGDVLDHESEEVPPNDEDSVFYPLATLTGKMWKEMGLHGPTRWKYLREDEFKDLFGMSKNSFEELQPWTQQSLKKKHGLF